MPKRKREVKTRTESGLRSTNHKMFQAAARAQKDCAVCGKVGGPFHPHHVIYEQHLRDHGLPKYDTMNARRVHPHCHWGHHNSPNVQIKTTALTDDNIRYAYDNLGAKATDYFRRYYDDTEPDPRIVAMEREFEREPEAA